MGAQMGTQRQNGVPTPPKGELVAKYVTYLDAQRAVDYLSDEQFPVQEVTIVGSGLRMVERVTGRLTYPRVAAAGAASGAWFGLFVGLLLSLFGAKAQAGSVVGAVAIGAAFGILFGVISYALTGGRRDFTSTSQIVASEYEVLCTREHADEARRLLIQLASGRRDDNFPPPVPVTQPEPVPAAAPVPVPSPGPAGTSVDTSAAAERDSEPVTGPTYGEMMEKRRLERLKAAQAEQGES
jgi:hypothetical protein